jgi:hypothetical protein
MEPVTNVATVTNPAPIADGSQTSTLENLGANIDAALNTGVETIVPPPTNESTSEAGVSTVVPPETPAATEPEVKESDAEVAAKATRLSQDNADLRATLTKLGVDPDGNTAEQLRSGLITIEDLNRSRQTVQPKTETTVPDAAAPVVSLDQKLINLTNTLSKPINTTGMTEPEYREREGKMLEVITGLVQANQNINQLQEDTALKTLLNDVQTATKDVFGTAVTVKVPDDVREIGESFFIGATDISVGNLAKEVGRNRAFTPEGYRHEATKLAPKFDQFVQSIYKAGVQAATEAINKGSAPPNQMVVNPLTPGGGGAPPAPPADKEHFDINRLNANVDAYMASTEAQV